jgi:hypothetical protein
MPYKYIIIDLEGTVSGTNDEDQARDMKSDDCTVIALGPKDSTRPVEVYLMDDDFDPYEIEVL